MGMAAVLFACSPEQIESVDESKLPQASELDVTVSVDQTTNYVTFKLNNPGMMPVWIFEATDPIDDASGAKVTGKKYAYQQNDLKLRFRNEGTHTVEVKAMNRNGLSQGSKRTITSDAVPSASPSVGGSARPARRTASSMMT